jgi:AcrR family transcriptional regulator
MAQTLAKTGRRLSGEKRREHLLDVAAQILLEHGFEALTMEAVKERAGVSRGLAYVHFANADELAFALYDREVSELDRRIATTRELHGNFEDRVRAAMRIYFDLAAERGGVMALLQLKLTGRFSQPNVQEQLARRFKFWADEIERELEVPASVAAALARAAVAGAEQFAAAWRAKKVSRAQAEAMAVGFVLGGVRGALADLERSGRKAS